MKASEWIDKVKAARGWESDYRAAKELGVHRNTISNYRSKTPTLDDETAVKVALALGIDPAGIVIDQVAERSKDPALSAALHRVAGSLCILCKVLGSVVKKSRFQTPPLNCTPLVHLFPGSGPVSA